MPTPKKGGLRETIDDISPIEDYTGNLAVVFGELWFEDPPASIDECREKDMIYSRPLNVKVAFQNRDTGEIREQTVFMGDFPWMTDWGTFIINGTERVVVTQLVRSPGAYVMEPKDREKQVFIANLMPARGSWLELEIDKKGRVYVRVDRKRKLPVTVLLRAIGMADDEEILKTFDNSVYIRNTIEADPEATRSEEGALIELFKKQRPGEPPTVDAARNLLNPLFFDPKRYDLTRVGRYKLNSRLGLDVDLDTRVLTREDIVSLVKELVNVPKLLGIAEDEEIKDYAAEAMTLPREPIEDHLDEYEHFGNRRLRTVGELIQEAFRIGLYRMERVVRERLTTEDADTITPQTIINIRPVVGGAEGVLRLLPAVAVHGPDELARRADAPAAPVGAGRRRPDARARPDRGARRAPDPLRPHVPDRDAGRPEHRPDRLAVVVRDRLRARLRPDPVPDGRRTAIVTNKIVWLDATQEEEHVIAQANAEIGPGGKLKGPQVLCRARDGELVTVPPKDVDLMDVSPTQIWSVATALIPFLEHDDANRALMGSNMQRQAVPLLRPEPPLIGTGMERRAAIDTGDVVRRQRGRRGHLRGRRARRGRQERARAPQVHALQPGHADRPAAAGERRRPRQGGRRARGRLVHRRGELALGKNVTVAFMSWEGYNFEDAIVISERLVKDDVLTSIHIEEYEIDARTTKLGDEEITRDIPNRSEESLRNLDERGVVRIGAEVGLRRPAGREGHAQGRDRADRRGEADPRDLQGEGARGPRHLAQGAARRGRCRDRREDLLARRTATTCPPASTTWCGSTWPASARSPRATSSPAGTATRA